MNNFKTLFLLTSLFSWSFSFSQFPGCPSVDAGVDQNLDCFTPCTNLTATPFNAGATTSYSVGAIPHNPPIAYNQAGGTGVSVGTDDVWSPIITLPFTFCFYGQTYTTCKIGSNGAIKFGPPTGGGTHPWSYTASCPSASLVAAGNVFGPYHDIDPSVAGTVKWYVLGTAPCRIFVVSYYDLAHFSCTSLRSTHMMVLYETTNAIDVYINNKASCPGWNSGNTVVGIQNNAGTAGITPPGRNTGAWTVTTPEAWRFLPNGAPIYTVEWLEGGNVISNSTTVSVCPSVPTVYTARATYTSCSGDVIIEEDQVTVNPAVTGLTLSEISNTPTSCGASNGSVEVSAAGGTPSYTYSMDNITYQASGIFSGLAMGTYTIFGKDNAGCITTLQITINDNSTLGMTITQAQNVLCNGTNTGSITATPSAGTAPYSFTLNGGASVPSGDFTNLTAGNYTIIVTDFAGCSVTIDTLLTQPTPLNLNEVSTNNSSCNLPNGSFEVSASGGTSPYQFSTDNGTTNQASGIFSGISAGLYTVLLTDNNACTQTLDVTVGANSSPILTVTSFTNVTCNGAANGSVQLSTSGGATPYNYSVNGGPSQASSLFSNLTPGVYNFNVTDANSCNSTVQVTITEPAQLTINVTANQTICAGTSVTLIATTSGGTGSPTYSWSNGAITSSITVSPSVTTTYTVTVTDANSCTNSGNTTVTVLPYPFADAQENAVTGYPPLVVTFDNLSSNASSYIWNFGNGQTSSSSTTNSVTNAFDDPGTYYVTLTASNGLCQDTWTTTIIVIPFEPLEVYVPNVFTPNNDGSNDFYFIDTKNAVSLEAVIVDRWGITIIDFDDINDKWDGKVKGKDAVDGTYFIKFKVTGLDKTMQEGHTFFQLVR